MYLFDDGYLKKTTGRLWVAGLLILAGPVCLSEALCAAEENEKNVSKIDSALDETYFHCTETVLRKGAGFTVLQLRYPSYIETGLEVNNWIKAEYYMPDGADSDGKKRPAVVCLHILGGDFTLVRLLCSVLAQNGVPSVMFKMPYYDERGGGANRTDLLGNPKILSESMAQALYDVHRTVTVMRSRPEIDENKISIAGISMGGFIGAIAAARDDRIHRLSMILAGGNLLEIIEEARETRALRTALESFPEDELETVRAAFQSMDPLTHADALRRYAHSKRLQMINATDDNVVTPRSVAALAKALDFEENVIWLDGFGHYTTLAALPEILGEVTAFFAEDLPPGILPHTPVFSDESDLQVTTRLVGELGNMLSGPTTEQAGNILALEFQFTPAKGEQLSGSLYFAIGADNRFLIECVLPRIGNARIGQSSAAPWIESPGKCVFVGALNPLENRNPLMFLRAEHQLRLRLGTGFLSTIPLAPDLFGKYVRFSGENRRDTRVIMAESSRKSADQMKLTLKEDGRTPDSLTLVIGGNKADIRFTQWLLNTPVPDELFMPADSLPVEKVRQDDVYRSFSAVVSYLFEMF